jgi:hypothetical protein
MTAWKGLGVGPGKKFTKEKLDKMSGKRAVSRVAGSRLRVNGPRLIIANVVQKKTKRYLPSLTLTMRKSKLGVTFHENSRAGI